MSVYVTNAEVSEGFAEMQGLHADREMRVEPKTWGELAWGMYLTDTNGKCWQVCGGPVMGWLRVVNIHGEEKSIPPQPLDKQVNVVVLPEDEAVLLLERTLGAKVISDNFTIARQLLVAERWAVAPMPATGNKAAARKLKDHLDWFHGSQWVEPSRSVEEMAEIHAEMHASAGDMPMSHPHHHTSTPGGA